MSIQAVPSPDQFISVIHRHEGQAELWSSQSALDSPRTQMSQHCRWGTRGREEQSVEFGPVCEHSLQRQLALCSKTNELAVAEMIHFLPIHMHRIKKNKILLAKCNDTSDKKKLPLQSYLWYSPKIGEGKKAGSHSIEILSPHPFPDLRVSHETINHTLSSSAQPNTAACCRWCPKNTFVYFASLQAAKLHLRFK